MSLVILGASRGPGRLLFEQFVKEQKTVTGIARHQNSVETGDSGSFIEADLETDDITELLGPETTLIHCGPPQALTKVLEMQPSLLRLVALGSTRLFTKFPDQKQRRVAAMTNAIDRSRIPATVIHPTLIYGAPGLNNIERIVRFASLSPLLPLPAGGRSLIQPVYADDVVRAVQSSLESASTIGQTYILPGPSPVSYREFVESCVEAAGLNSKVVSVPYRLLQLLIPITRLLPNVPTITGDELERLKEDKDFSAKEIKQALELSLTPLEEGLSRTLSPLKQT